MAKKRVKSKSKSIRKKPMATTRKKRRRKSPVSRTRTRLSAAPVRRRRRKKGLFSSGGNTGLMAAVKHNGAGAIGGALFAGTRLIHMPLWMRLAAGAGGCIGLSMAGMPFVAAGLAGATSYHAAQTLLPATLLNDDGEDLEDADYVDSDTLEDIGYVDEEGNPIVMDDDNVMYALSDDGLEAIGYGTDIQSVSMIPLQDAYSLNAGNPYDLASGW